MSREAGSGDVWAEGGAYERYIGRWSRVVALEFVRWLALPEGAAWLDVGCGTGALTETLLTHAAPRSVVGVDRSPQFIQHCRGKLSRPSVIFQEGNAEALPVASGTFDAVVSGLVLNFVPRPARMVEEMARAARAGATIAVYVWDYAGGLELVARFWAAAREIDASSAALDESVRFRDNGPGPLGALFAGAGLSGVAIRSIEIPTVFPGFDAYWSPFLGGQGPAPAYLRSLPEERRTALRERLRKSLPAAPDGSIHLSARVWAARGITPGRAASA
jgi:SAM-dependent methyltransferase